MIFTRVGALFLAVLPALAAATPVLESRGGGGSGSGSCSTGSMQCCNQVQKASDPKTASILGLLGIIADPTAQVGLDCSPISVASVANGNCKSNAVCCTDNNHGGVVSLGCVPVSF